MLDNLIRQKVGPYLIDRVEPAIGQVKNWKLFLNFMVFIPYLVLGLLLFCINAQRRMECVFIQSAFFVVRVDILAPFDFSTICGLQVLNFYPKKIMVKCHFSILIIAFNFIPLLSFVDSTLFPIKLLYFVLLEYRLLFALPQQLFNWMLFYYFRIFNSVVNLLLKLFLNYQVKIIVFSEIL